MTILKTVIEGNQKISSFSISGNKRLISFYRYIYSRDSQESIKGAMHRASNYPDLLPKMPRYCCPLAIFILFLVLWKYN